MRESIELVEKTRDERLKHVYKETFRFLTLEERAKILSKYHPDYKQEMKRPVRIGPSKGEVMPNEVANLVESHPLIRPEDIDLSKIDYDTDILILGSGGTGLAAALWAKYS